MSKQIYIDSNGNENLISGTINTGETLPLTTNPADVTVSEAIGDLSDLTTTNNDSLVDAVNEVNKPIVIDVDGGTITVSHIGNIYTIGLDNCPVVSIYSILASYTTAKKFRFVAWDTQYNKACIISIGGGSVTVYADTMVQIPNTDNRTVSGGATYIKS